MLARILRQAVSGGARWQAPKPDLHSILRANFTAPDAPPMPSTDTRESRGKQQKGAWMEGGLEVQAAQIGAAVSPSLVMLLTKRSPLPLPNDWLRLPY